MMLNRIRWPFNGSIVQNTYSMVLNYDGKFEFGLISIGF